MIESALRRLSELGYLDDGDYARRRALLMAERGYGDYAIRLFLEGLGLPEKMACEALDALPVSLSEVRRLHRIIEKRGSLPRAKLVRFLAGRGFPMELIIETIRGEDA